MGTTISDGKKIILTEDDWFHIKFRHPEVGSNPNLILRTVAEPEGLYHNARGRYHALSRMEERYFLVVIYELTDDEGYIRTAYLINERRKKRRYGALRSLKLS